MKRLKQHWSTPLISALLSALMVLPVFCLFLFAAPAAQAQGLTARQPTWAILDFANPSGYGGGDVGRLASDSFVVQLSKLNRYAVLPRQDLLNGIQSENLTPPLNLTSIRRLGESLGVDAIVAGEIASVSFSRDRRQAKVNVVVRVIDPRSGYLLNGALAEGLSNPRPIPVTDEEQLVNEAFGNAAFNAVKQISKFNLPVATVLIGRDTTSVTLNKGSRDGLYNGLDMLVTRNGVVTGTIRISEATNNDSNATVTDQGTGIRPEDRATAIYHLPSYSVNKNTGTYDGVKTGDVAADMPSASSKHNAFSGIGGVLIAILAGVLLFSLIKRHKDGGLGNASVDGPQAVAGRSQDLGGPAVPLGGTISIADYVPVSVRITSDIGNVNPNNFLEYHVYRSDSPTVLTSPASLGVVPVVTTSTGGNNGNNNGGNNNGGNNGTGGGLGLGGFGPIPLLAQSTHGRLLVFDDSSNKTSVVASKPDLTDSATLVSVTVTGPLSTPTNPTGGLPNTGLQFGQRVSYTVEGLYLQPATFNSGSINPGTSSGGSTNTNTNGNNNNNGGQNNGGQNNGGQNNGGQNNGGQNTSGQNTSGTTNGHGQTYQLTGRRNTNSVTLIEPVHPSAGAVQGTGNNNINVSVPATRGADDYIIQVSTNVGFTDAVTFKSVPGSYANTASQFTPTQGSPVVFNNINLTTAFPNGTFFFYRIGARDPANGGDTGSNPYIFSDPLSLAFSSGAPPTQPVQSTPAFQGRAS